VLAGAMKTLKKFRPIVQFEIGVQDAKLGLEDYLFFQAPGGPNKICIPKENPKTSVTEALGWKRLD
jgi:hypothetical protein